MPRRWTNLRPHGVKKGDKVKVLGGNACIGMEGIAEGDGEGSQHVMVQFDGMRRKIKAERLVVLELGPAGPTQASNYPHPVSDNFHVRKTNPGARKKIELKNQKGQTVATVEGQDPGEWEHVPEGDEEESDPKPKESKMAEKEAKRKGRSEWGFD